MHKGICKWQKIKQWYQHDLPFQFGCHFHVMLSEEYVHNSLHLAQKYARISVHGHYLFREANSFLKTKLKENCELWGTDNAQGQISSIFSPQTEAIVFVVLQIFFGTCTVLKFEEYSPNSPIFGWGIFGLVMCFAQSCSSKKIWWVIRPDIFSSDSLNRTFRVCG